MKRERLEELVVQVTWALTRGADSGHVQTVRAALLAVERETVERCAEVCEGFVLTKEEQRESYAASGNSGDIGTAYADDAYEFCAKSIRSLLTEET